MSKTEKKPLPLLGKEGGFILHEKSVSKKSKSVRCDSSIEEENTKKQVEVMVIRRILEGCQMYSKTFKVNGYEK